MKRILSIGFEILFYLIVASILLSVGSQLFTERAWGWSMVGGDSMSPALEQGDLVFVVPYFADKSGLPQVGSITAFEDGQGSKVIHRIVENTERGYITKGDANLHTDQQSGQNWVTPAMLYGTALSLNGQVIKIPVIGALALDLIKPGMRLPLTLLLVAITAVLIILYFARWRKKRPRLTLTLKRVRGLNGIYAKHRTALKYGVMTIVGAAILMSAMVRVSSSMDFCYAVSQPRESIRAMATSGGINLGVVSVGGEQSCQLQLSSSFPVPMYALFVGQSDDICFPQNPMVIAPKQSTEIETVVKGGEDNIGTHTMPVTALILPPVLPADILNKLASYHQMLALFVISVMLMMVLSIPAGVAEYLLGREKRPQMIRRLKQRRGAK